MKKIILIQAIVLLFGTLFAWFNFSKEYISWLSNSTCTIGCTAGVSPFLTPCFGGAIFFTIAFVIHLMIMRRGK
jgi:hypothetical protein